VGSPKNLHPTAIKAVIIYATFAKIDQASSATYISAQPASNGDA